MKQCVKIILTIIMSGTGLHAMETQSLALGNNADQSINVQQTSVPGSDQWCADFNDISRCYYRVRNDFLRLKVRNGLFKKITQKYPDIQLDPLIYAHLQVFCAYLWQQIQTIVNDPHNQRYQFIQYGNSHSMHILHAMLRHNVDDNGYCGIKALFDSGVNPNTSLSTVHKLLPVFMPHGISIAQLLEQYGADVRVSDDHGEVITHKVMKKEFPYAIARYYMKKYPDLSNAKEESSITPLHMLVLNGHEYKNNEEEEREWRKKCSLLLEYQANINAQDINEQTPLDYVSDRQNSCPTHPFFTKVEARLRSAGAINNASLPATSS